MDNSVTEDKAINEATVFEWLELTIVEPFWVSDIFETNDSLNEIFGTLSISKIKLIWEGAKLWKRIQTKVGHVFWTLWWGRWDCVWWNVWTLLCPTDDAVLYVPFEF